LHWDEGFSQQLVLSFLFAFQAPERANRRLSLSELSTPELLLLAMVRSYPVFPLAVKGKNAVVTSELPHPQLQAFELPQAAAKEELHRQAAWVIKLFDDRIDLFPGKHHRNVV
jgi:hypothetical protein